jgi:hypothetical protein
MIPIHPDTKMANPEVDELGPHEKAGVARLPRYNALPTVISMSFVRFKRDPCALTVELSGAHVDV